MILSIKGEIKTFTPTTIAIGIGWPVHVTISWGFRWFDYVAKISSTTVATNSYVNAVTSSNHSRQRFT